MARAGTNLRTSYLESNEVMPRPNQKLLVALILVVAVVLPGEVSYVHVAAWAPDGRKVAFVWYEEIPEPEYVEQAAPEPPPPPVAHTPSRPLPPKQTNGYDADDLDTPAYLRQGKLLN